MYERVPHGLPSSSICCSATYGMGVTTSNRGCSASRAAATAAACSSGSPKPTRISATTGAKWCSTGTNGAGWCGGAHDRGAHRRGRARPRRRARPAARAPRGPARREHRELHERADLVEPELELGDDAEVAATAAQRPEEIGVLGLARPDPAAVGKHDLRRFEVVDRQPVQPAEPAPSTAESEPADTRVAHRPGRHGEAVLLAGGVELTEGGAAADAGAASLRVDDHVVDRAEIDHHAALGHRGAPVAVAAPAYGHLEARRPGRTATRPRRRPVRCTAR